MAFACISKKTLSGSGDKRPNIKSKPDGFPESEQKNTVNGRLIFQRCHLIGYHLFAKNKDKGEENANLKRIFTGTRFMNHVMFYYEKKIADYVRKDKNRKVYYRATRYSEVGNKVAYGVQLEAKFIDKNGNEDKDLSFNVFVYNKQPGIHFEYETGIIKEEESINLSEEMAKEKRNYIINKRKKKIHLKCCASVWDLSEERREKFPEKQEDIINGKYRSCAICDSGPADRFKI